MPQWERKSAERRRILQRILVATVVPGLLLLLGEGVCRIFEPSRDLVGLSSLGGARLPAWFLQDPSLVRTLGHLDKVPEGIDPSEILDFWRFYNRDRELHFRLAPKLDAWTVNTFSPLSLKTNTLFAESTLQLAKE